MKDSIDNDPLETKEWLDALRSVFKHAGPKRANYLLSSLVSFGAQLGALSPDSLISSYANTLSSASEAIMPDDGQYLDILTNIMRWNAIAMVMRAGRVNPNLGGHIASFGSIATLFEVGFHYFFHASQETHGGDLIYFQGHSAPGIYARAFLEGRLNATHLDGFRQEIFKKGVSSYPHPWLMPDFWQFPTVSMGLGPLMGIYQARFLRYLQHRKLADTKNRKVWVFCGDGEMGEPESLGAINLAARERLDNLIFVINCNLQRLDGPVWGNGQVIQEYEAIFRGAGWNVIKVIWGRHWDKLLAKDKKGCLLKRMSELPDGEYQLYGARDGAFMREHFFGKSPELSQLVEDWSNEDLECLLDGGHDPQKVYAAYAAAVSYKGKPTVILAKTVKGYGMGSSGEGQNVTHQTKKIAVEDLKRFRDRFALPISDKAVEQLDYYKPSDDSPEMQYLHKQRQNLGGYLPSRCCRANEQLIVPTLTAFKEQLNGTHRRHISTTMAFVRILSILLKDKNIKDRIVPIVADESRTFGMEGLFRQIGIYSPLGQCYEPEDRKSLLYYREDKGGQLFQEGISESGAMSCWIAAATSYASSQLPMIPFYIYYSMFGYQRFGDLAWAAGDIRARGFILGGTAGRTTLAGEGLQHQDGHNLLMFSMIPNCVSYDPTFSYELAVIIQDGLDRMYVKQEDVYYYITLMNENYVHPSMPKGVEAGILKGMYLFRKGSRAKRKRVQLLGSGTILREVIAAADWLEKEKGIAADIWSVTSFNELRKDIESVARYNRLHSEANGVSYVAECLSGSKGPVVAATDYVKLFADQIRSAIDVPYYVLGTDGFGRSDTREALRDFFEVDAKMIAYTALKGLFDMKQLDSKQLKQSFEELKIDSKRVDPVSC